MDFAERARPLERQELSVALLDGLLRISQVVRLRLNDWLDRFELNDGRHSVLTVLARAGDDGCSQAELAERLGQSESNVSTLIERMQRDGLVNRLRSSFDRRKRVLSITDTGRAVLTDVDSGRSAWCEKLFRGITVADRATLMQILTRLGSSLESSSMTAASHLAIFSEPAGDHDLPADGSASDLSEDPQSPQYALRKMLLALSASAVHVPDEKEAA
jgi:DNA-binding MarR family transcriptional regulator